MSTRFEIPDWLPRAAPPLPPVDDLRVEGLVNRFITAKQQALFTAPDAFYRQEGGDALAVQPALAQGLQALRTAVLDLAANDGERAALGPRLDAHIEDAMDGIGRHIEAQRKVFQRRTVAERQALIRRATELEPDDDDKIAGLAEAQASAARELARLDGLAAGSAEEAEALTAARSQILSDAIAQRIAANKPAQAVALYERVRAALAPADRRALEGPIGVAADDAATDTWLEREAGKDGAPLIERAGLDDSLSAPQRLIVAAKVSARDSAEESRRFATVKGLDDRRARAIVTIATQPSAHRIGTLSTLADAYAAAGAPDQATETRRLALLEPFFLPFARLGVAAQQRHLETLSGAERDFAEAILRHQADAFARDPYAAGTALYPDVGLPVPISDLDGRIAQARTINALRNAYVPPFSIHELTEAGREFAKASPEERDAMLRRVDALPDEVRKPLLDALSAPKEGPNQASLSDRPSETQEEREKRLFGVPIPRPDIPMPPRPRLFFEPLSPIPEPLPPPRPPEAPPPAPGHRIALPRG